MPTTASGYYYADRFTPMSAENISAAEATSAQEVFNGLDARNTVVVADFTELFDLDTVGKLAGDLAYVTEGLVYMSLQTSGANGVWRQITTAVFGNTSSRDSAYAKAGSAYLVPNVKSFDAATLTEETYSGSGWTSGGSFVGNVQMSASDSIPNGWLLCDGAPLSRSTYAQLFNAIGVVYGAGDGSTTFNVPDMSGRVAVGKDSAQSEFNSLGEIGGAKTHTLTIAEMPAHNHALPGALVPRGTGAQFRELAGVGSNNVSSFNRGGNEGHNNLQPYRVLNFIIKT